MIDRADLVDDAELASFDGRVARRDEFVGMVTQWTQTRTTQEIVDLAVAFRIPVAPIATPATLPRIDHFVQRGVFVESEAGVLQPRVPYRSDAMTTRPPGRPPRLGADNGRVHWPPRTIRARAADADALPLSDIRITDFTAFWAGPVATQLLGALGADVIKVEGVRRPDGMRFSAGRPPSWDQWWEWGPVFLCSNNNKRGVSVELSTDAGRAIALELIAASDLVIENFSPRVMDELRSGLGCRERGQPARHHGADAGVRPRRPVARPRRLRPDDGAGDRHGVDDRTRRRPAGDSARRVRPDSGPARRLRRRRRAGDPRPRRDRDARRVHHGGGGAERGRRDAGGVLAQRNRDAPRRESGSRRQPPGRVPLPG